MLDKPSKNTEPAPARRIFRFFGLDKSRNKASPTAKDRPAKEPEERNGDDRPLCAHEALR
jgi:hypothetical protein